MKKLTRSDQRFSQRILKRTCLCVLNVITIHPIVVQTHSLQTTHANRMINKIITIHCLGTLSTHFVPMHLANVEIFVKISKKLSLSLLRVVNRNRFLPEFWMYTVHIFLKIMVWTANLKGKKIKVCYIITYYFIYSTTEVLEAFNREPAEFSESLFSSIFYCLMPVYGSKENNFSQAVRKKTVHLQWHHSMKRFF